jgi:adenylylsulfate kinase
VGHVESHYRSIVKAVSYRILGSTTTALIFYVLTGKGSLSLGAGALDMVLKIGVYFIHERLWNHINFGRSTSTKAPEYEI